MSPDNALQPQFPVALAPLADAHGPQPHPLGNGGVGVTRNAGQNDLGSLNDRMGQGTAIGDALTFAAMKAQRKANGMAMKQGAIIDARILAAPSSTKNKRQKRYPVMHQDCKEKQWHFAMKVHLEVDS